MLRVKLSRNELQCRYFTTQSKHTDLDFPKQGIYGGRSGFDLNKK